MRVMSDTQSRPAFPDSRPASPQRILAVVSEVARYGLLTSEQVARVDGGSRQTCTRILQFCVEAKLLRRLDRAPEAFLGSFFDARPRVFGVTAKGLRALADAGMALNVKPKRSAVLLAHEIETANFCFDLRAAVAAHGKIHLVDEPELLGLMPLRTQQMDKPTVLNSKAHPRDFPDLSAILKESLSLGTEPDRLQLIVHADNTAQAFAIELDRSNETLSARRLTGKATWARKVVGYHSCWLQGAHLSQWGDWCRSFRVVIITTSEGRLRNMIDIQQHITRGVAGLFVYATPERIKQYGVLGPAWSNGKREHFSLIEE